MGYLEELTKDWPRCPACGNVLVWAFYAAAEDWRQDWCQNCKSAEDLSVQMAEGTSVWFPYTFREKNNTLVDRNTVKYVDVSTEVAARCRYHGQMVLVDDENLAVFYDPASGRFYGQPV